MPHFAILGCFVKPITFAKTSNTACYKWTSTCYWLTISCFVNSYDDSLRIKNLKQNDGVAFPENTHYLMSFSQGQSNALVKTFYNLSL